MNNPNQPHWNPPPQHGYQQPAPQYGHAYPGYMPPQAPRRASPWKTIGIIAGCLGAVVAIFVMLSAAFVLTAREEPASQADMQLVLTIDELAEWFTHFEPQPGVADAKRTKFIDGSYEVSYEYDTDDVYLYSMFSDDKKASDATVSYNALQIGWNIGADRNTELRETNMLSWGDTSKCFIIYYDGAPIGNRFIARKGQYVIDVTFSGGYFDEAEAYRELMQPLLDRLNAHR